MNAEFLVYVKLFFIGLHILCTFSFFAGGLS